MTDALLSLKEVAQLLGFHPETLRRNVKRYSYPHYKIGGELRFKLEELLNATRVGNNDSRRDCVDEKGEDLCHSTNNATQSIGGVNSQHQTERLYDNLLGLKTKP
ncbi:helix-turn-helix domain-containing protein [Thiomicrorhabdus xiamenensis]|uniref:Helix-turn-helix domain-containing protein n=1 Tax=Thiomicrorhabdus xiamenensis TaxID=2739063 RepID=A0A7D4T004_9GAMM|nr:helix-turn-helix domain-containing protein [Thiomicrorhabdus xiamenensis]